MTVMWVSCVYAICVTDWQGDVHQALCDMCGRNDVGQSPLWCDRWWGQLCLMCVTELMWVRCCCVIHDRNDVSQLLLCDK